VKNVYARCTLPKNKMIAAQAAIRIREIIIFGSDSDTIKTFIPLASWTTWLADDAVHQSTVVRRSARLSCALEAGSRSQPSSHRYFFCRIRLGWQNRRKGTSANSAVPLNARLMQLPIIRYKNDSCCKQATNAVRCAMSTGSGEAGCRGVNCPPLSTFQSELPQTGEMESRSSAKLSGLPANLSARYGIQTAIADEMVEAGLAKAEQTRPA